MMLAIAQRRGARAVRSTQSLWHVVARDDDVFEAGGMTSHASAEKKRSFGAQARAASAYYGGGGQVGFVRSPSWLPFAASGYARGCKSHTWRWLRSEEVCSVLGRRRG